jgi:hypothetical protein
MKDNFRVTKMLERLFEGNSYKKDILLLPKEHVLAVMNLTSHVSERTTTLL